MEVLFAKAFLSTPGSTRGFVKPKGSKKIMLPQTTLQQHYFNISA